VPIIINGGSYSAGGWWGKHLQNAEKNERVAIIEFSGLFAETIPDAFRDMKEFAANTKCKNYFYQANINPRADETLTPAQWREAIDRLEKNLGFTGQPRFVVEHEKEGRTHRHVIWSRIDIEHMRAIPDSLTAAIHERTSRELEIRFDLERGQSILVPDRETERPERRPQKHEIFRADEIDPEKVKADLKLHWSSADNGHSFRAALEVSGDYVLARGDRRDFVVIDRAGDDHSLARRLGVKVAEVRARMADLDPASLPSVNEAKVQQRERQVEREADRTAGIAAAAQRAMREARAAAKGRTDDTRAAFTAAAQEATQRPEPVAARETRAEVAEPSHSPQPADHGEFHSPTAIAEGFLRGIGRRLAILVEAVAEFLAPAPPLTKVQAELKERADEERADARAQWNVIEERATSDLDRLIAEMQQQQQQRDAEAPPRQRERDDDRGYERER
jgi:hypothetical protein